MELCDFGKRLLDRELDDIKFIGTYVEDGEEISMSRLPHLTSAGDDSNGPSGNDISL